LGGTKPVSRRAKEKVREARRKYLFSDKKGEKKGEKAKAEGGTSFQNLAQNNKEEDFG